MDKRLVNKDYVFKAPVRDRYGNIQYWTEVIDTKYLEDVYQQGISDTLAKVEDIINNFSFGDTEETIECQRALLKEISAVGKK